MLNNLDKIYSITRNISKENSIVETSAYFQPNLKQLIFNFNTNTTHIILKGLNLVNWSSLEGTKKIIYHAARAIRKHEKHSKSTLAVLSFKIIPNIIHLDYADNRLGATLDKITLQNGL